MIYRVGRKKEDWGSQVTEELPSQAPQARISSVVRRLRDPAHSTARKIHVRFALLRIGHTAAVPEIQAVKGSQTGASRVLNRRKGRERASSVEVVLRCRECRAALCGAKVRAQGRGVYRYASLAANSEWNDWNPP